MQDVYPYETRALDTVNVYSAAKIGNRLDLRTLVLGSEADTLFTIEVESPSALNYVRHRCSAAKHRVQDPGVKPTPAARSGRNQKFRRHFAVSFLDSPARVARSSDQASCIGYTRSRWILTRLNA